MSVADRIAAIKTIFNDFGIQVPDNSVLDQTIHAEFGRGKRSNLNNILLEINHSTEAATLAICIGTALHKYAGEPEIDQISLIMCEHLPAALQIFDLRQQTTKRIELLEQFLLHFEAKLPPDNRLVSMLQSSRAQLRDLIQVEALAAVLENLGIIAEVQELSSCGRILKVISPALVALDNAEISSEQKINLTVRALALMGHELNNTNLIRAASIIDTLHCLAKVCLVLSPELPTIEQALQNLDLSLGTVTIMNLRNKARALGLTDTELSQVLYSTKECSGLAAPDQELLAATKENKQYAAACGLVTKLGQDIGCSALERVGVAGICLVSMRQTFCEIKANSLNAANFSESLGLIVSGVGTLTQNKTAVKLGAGIIEGVRTYAGIAAIPGGSIVAIPLAICGVLSKLLLGSKSRKSRKNCVTTEVVLQHLLGQVQQLQLEMRKQFAGLYELAHIHHQQLLNTMQQGFTRLASYTQAQTMQSTLAIKTLERNLDFMHSDLSKKFSDLYLEYVYNPIEEINFFSEYKHADGAKLRDNKLKLSMWLLFKSKNSKANGRDLIANFEGHAQMSSCVRNALTKTADYDSVLGMVNHYVNLEFARSLPEDLPHIPTWILAADQYILLLSTYSEHLDLKTSEPKILDDIIKVGEQLLTFAQQLASTDSVLAIIVKTLESQYAQAQLLVKQILATSNSSCLLGIEQLLAVYKPLGPATPMLAESAPLSEQLENFTPFSLDLSAAWYLYILEHVPAHVRMAVDFELGDLSLKFAIAKEFNNFATAPTTDEDNLLTDQARYVLYKIDLHFTLRENAQRTLILSAWFAYDLYSADKRRTEYCRPKYLTPVSSGSRRRIGLNHAPVHISRPVNLDRLAKVYQDWWPQALPINTPEILARLKNHAKFYSKCQRMLDRGLCVDLKFGTTLLLQIQLQIQVQNIMLSQRQQIARGLQASKTLETLLEKIDTYCAVLIVFKQILNMPVSPNNLSKKLQDLVALMAQGTAINQDLDLKLRELLDSSAIALSSSLNYKDGPFYQKINYTLSQLHLLANILPTLSLRL